MMRTAWLALGAWALLAGCAGLQDNAYYDPAKPHHTPTGFRNPDPAARPAWTRANSSCCGWAEPG